MVSAVLAFDSHSGLQRLAGRLEQLDSAVGDAIHPEIEAWLHALPSVKVNRGKAVFDSTKDMEGMFWIKTGFVGMHFSTEEGKMVYLGIHGNREVFRLSDRCSSQAFNQDLQATALTDCLLYNVPGRTLIGTQQWNWLSSAMIKTYARREHANRLVQTLRILHSQHRIVPFLVHLFESYGEPRGKNGKCLPFLFNQERIAASLGMTRETVARVLPGLAKAGLIGREKGLLSTPDLDQLRAFYEEPIAHHGASSRQGLPAHTFI